MRRLSDRKARSSAEDVKGLSILSFDSVLIFVPLFMPRPALAAQANCPAPLVAAAGAESASLKRIPRRAAAVEEVLRVIAVTAIPAAGRLWAPLTERATNAAELISFVARRIFLSGFRRLQSLLE